MAQDENRRCVSSPKCVRGIMITNMSGCVVQFHSETASLQTLQEHIARALHSVTLHQKRSTRDKSNKTASIWFKIKQINVHADVEKSCEV